MKASGTGYGQVIKMTEKSQAAYDTGNLESGENDTLTTSGSVDSFSLKRYLRTMVKIIPILCTFLAGVWIVMSAWGGVSGSLGRIEERTINTQKDVGELKIGIMGNQSSIEESTKTLTDKLHDVDKRLSIIEDRLSSISDDEHKPNQADLSVTH